MKASTPIWPNGKRFAFTIFDDTDMATIDNCAPVYKFLESLGMRTTKSVWPNTHTNPKVTWGSSCTDPNYLDWIKSLQKSGFEIALHNAAATSSPRIDCLKALKKFREDFGQDPYCFANHAECRDTMYWAADRFSFPVKQIYNLLTGFRKTNQSQGHQKSSDYFWGDHCQTHIKYVRNFVFNDINTLKACPEMPYHDPAKPFVDQWFASANGTDVTTFNKCLDDKNQQRLEEEGGLCIVYTHLARGFYLDGSLDPTFVRIMEKLSKRPGWFVPTGEVLDFLGNQERPPFSPSSRRRLERRWLLEKIMGAPQ